MKVIYTISGSSLHSNFIVKVGEDSAYESSRYNRIELSDEEYTDYIESRDIPELYKFIKDGKKVSISLIPSGEREEILKKILIDVTMENTALKMELVERLIIKPLPPYPKETDPIETIRDYRRRYIKNICAKRIIQGFEFQGHLCECSYEDQGNMRDTVNMIMLSMITGTPIMDDEGNEITHIDWKDASSEETFYISKDDYPLFFIQFNMHKLAMIKKSRGYEADISKKIKFSTVMSVDWVD